MTLTIEEIESAYKQGKGMEEFARAIEAMVKNHKPSECDAHAGDLKIVGAEIFSLRRELKEREEYIGRYKNASAECETALLNKIAKLEAEIARLREALDLAVKTLKFCAQWGGRSGRIPDPQPGSKIDHVRKALPKIKEILAALPTQPEQGQGQP